MYSKPFSRLLRNKLSEVPKNMLLQYVKNYRADSVL
jgi:hypothetical protein